MVVRPIKRGCHFSEPILTNGDRERNNKNAMNVQPILVNPTLGYRLDPGEPGVLKTSSARDSTRAVTSQELHNIYRLQSKALMEGRIIVYANIAYAKTFSGSYLATTSGLTTVVSMPGPQFLSKIRQQAKTGQAASPASLGNNNQQRKTENSAKIGQNVELLSQGIPAVSSTALLRETMNILAAIREIDHKLSMEGNRDFTLLQKRARALQALMDIERQRFSRGENQTKPTGKFSMIDLMI